MTEKAGVVLMWMVLAAAGSQAQSATATLQPTQGNKVQGTIVLMTMGSGVHFTGTVTGLTPGKHGFHVHENGDCSAPDASSAGGHFNPEKKAHGTPTAAERHAGDLGNIEADASGTAKVDIHANGITLGSGANSVLGKAIIVHANPDDFSQPTGNAGGRLACGVIK
ncbi:MAG TPA: superoxide dismutase family protein [Terriglobia bacterium]|nr:superoxide dismutase family protein [Terriglobia bacterium]